MKFPKEHAIQTAMELAKINIESSNEWVSPEEVNYFIENVYSFLVDENEKDG